MKQKRTKAWDAEGARALLKMLAASARAKPRHKWQDMAEAMWDWGVLDITARGVTVPLEDGSRTFEVEGWTEELYAFVSPPLEPWDKAMLAKAVLEDLLRRGGCQEPDTALWLLRKKHGLDEEEWLPQLVEAEGFSSVALRMSQEVAAYRRTNPSGRVTPRWDGHVLSWRGVEWTFRNQPGPVRGVLDFLQQNQWRPGIVPSLDPPQAVEAAKYLRQKTRPHINWKASDDGWINPIF
jgi:hypothetical protein